MKSLTLPQKVQELFLPKRIEAKKLEKHFKAFPENIHICLSFFHGSCVAFAAAL